MVSPRSDDQILVAEDNPLLAELLVDQLTLGGWRVACARDGVEALTMIDQLRPCMLVLDIGLPKLDGFAVMAELAARQGAAPADAPDMPIIVMSGYGASEDRNRAFALGAADVLVKPVSYQILLRSVGRHRSAETPACAHA